MCLINRLFCNHDFQIYHTGYESPNIFCPYDTPTTYLRCIHCGKIRRVNNYWLMEHAKIYSEVGDRLNFKEYREYNIAIYPFGNQAYGYSGYTAYSLIQEVFGLNDKHCSIEKKIDLQHYYNKSVYK